MKDEEIQERIHEARSFLFEGLASLEAAQRILVVIRAENRPVLHASMRQSAKYLQNAVDLLAQATASDPF